MDEDKKQKVKILFVVACLVIAVAITLATRGKSRGYKRTKGTLQMLCVNEECNAEYEMNAEQFQETMIAPPGPSSGARAEQGPRRFICPVCKEPSAFVAMKCVQCGLVFIPTYDDSQDYQDRCPECGYSGFEDRKSKKSKGE